VDLGSLAYIIMESELKPTATVPCVDLEGEEDYIEDFNEAAQAAGARAQEEFLEMEEDDRDASEQDYRAFVYSRDSWAEYCKRTRDKASALKSALSRVAPRGAPGSPELEQVVEIMEVFMGRETAERLCTDLNRPRSWSAFHDTVDYLQGFADFGSAESASMPAIGGAVGGSSGGADASGADRGAHPFRHAVGPSPVETVRPRKVYCGRCDCRVNPVGHAERCAPVFTVDPEKKSVMRRLAWLGDAAHLADVRRHLLFTGVSDTELEMAAQRYVSREAQAAYFSRVPEPEHPALGKSVSARSAAFEANYFGAFRQSYICEVLREDVCYSVPPYLRAYVAGFPFASEP